MVSINRVLMVYQTEKVAKCKPKEPKILIWVPCPILKWYVAIGVVQNFVCYNIKLSAKTDEKPPRLRP